MDDVTHVNMLYRLVADGNIYLAQLSAQLASIFTYMKEFDTETKSGDPSMSCSVA